jgi:hypothetical protein
MRYIYIIAIASSMIYGTCNYSKAVEKETMKKIVAHKEFLRGLSFDGVVRKKIHCDSCQVNKYRLVVNITDYSPKDVLLSNQFFEPYYSIDTLTKSFNLTVSKTIFEISESGMEVGKASASDSLILGGKPHLWLNEEKYKVLLL